MSSSQYESLHHHVVMESFWDNKWDSVLDFEWLILQR